MFPDGVKGAGRVMAGNPNPARRGLATGWSVRSARGNADFLKEVDPDRLEGHGLAMSLTFGRSDVVTPARLKKCRELLLGFLRDIGAIHYHWLVEFQADGAPHLHGLVIFEGPSSELMDRVLNYWLRLTEFAGSKSTGQHIKWCNLLKGWKKYLAKHGARGVLHYQRQAPEGWEHPGRLWGASRGWPRSRWEVGIDRKGFQRFRRVVRRWRVADVRKAMDQTERFGSDEQRRAARRRLVGARGMLRCADPDFSGVRGFSEWMPGGAAARVLWSIKREGCEVGDWEDGDPDVQTEADLLLEELENLDKQIRRLASSI